jgi:hypothetical protein
MNRVFFIYLDWTLEVEPRCFYVGKGDEARVKKRERNEYWRAIAAKYGWRREKILGTIDEVYAYEQEIEWIAQMRTYEGAGDGCWGANLTIGGSGVMTGRKHSEMTLAKMRGENHHCFGKFGQDHPWFGHRHTDEWKAQMSTRNSGSGNPMYGKPGAFTGKTHSREFIKRQSGENSVWAVLTKAQVKDIRRRYIEGRSIQRHPGVKVLGVTQVALVEEYGVKQATISDIITHKIWKEVE